MLRLLYGMDHEVARWSAEILGLRFNDDNLVSVGVVDGEDLIAGIVFTSYTQHPHSIEVSVASTTPRWATRRILRQLFAYPFEQLGVDRLEARCAVGDIETQSFTERLGLQLEGVKRRGYPTGGDAYVYSMLPHECHWLKA